MNKSDSIAALATALAKAQAQIKGAKKDQANPFFKSKYADLASVVEAIREPLSSNGLSYVQLTVPSDKDEVQVETMLMHSSGEWVAGVISVPVAKADAQGYGSALTYARRYALSAAVGVAAEDDDGNAAAKAAPPPKATHSPTDGALDALSPKDRDEAQRVASHIVDLWNESKEFAAYEAYYESGLDNEMMLGIWEALKPFSAIRNKLKAMHKNPQKEAA